MVGFRVRVGNGKKLVSANSYGAVSSSCSLFCDEGSSSLCSFSLPTWLGFGGSRVDLPPLVVTALTFSREFSGCSGIFPALSTGIAATIWANCVYIILLKLNWFLTEKVKPSIFELIFSIIFSLETSFFMIFSFILACPRTKSFKEGWFELKFELPPWYWGRN